MTSLDILTESDQAAVVAGCYFDAERAERAIVWIEATFRITLYAWQRESCRRYFGWRRADGSDRFLSIHVWIPKKNGKSFWVAVLLAYKLFQLRDANIFSAALNAKQAGVVLEQLIKLLKRNPKIRAMMRPRTGKVRAFNSPFRREVINDVTGCHYLSLSDNPDAADGLIPDVLVLDELHRMKNRTIDILEGNLVNNPQALSVSISTAGSGDQTHRAWQRYTDDKKILAGEVIDTQTLVVIYECPEAATLKGEEIYSLDVLLSCNPILVEDDEKRAQAIVEIAKAKRQRNDAWWRRFRLNQWLSQDGETFIDTAAYAACVVPPMTDAELAAADCFVGFDKSGGAWDFTALTALFRLDDGRVYEKHFTFAAGDRLKEMSERDDVEYSQFVAEGELIAIPAHAVTDTWLYDWCRDRFAGWRIKQIAADPYAAAYLLERWKADGFNVVAVQQSNNRLLSPVIEDYAARVRQLRIVHPPNRLTAWQLSCARAFTTAKDLKKIVKAGSSVRGTGGTGHIDNVDSTLNALAALRAAEIEHAAYGNSSGVVVA